MKTLISKLVILVFLSTTLVFTSCEKDPIKVAQPGPIFNIDKFKQNLDDALDDKATGYSFTITKNGQHYASSAGGWAVVPNSTQGGIAQSATKRMTIASVSKPITAVAALNVFETAGISLDANFADYLPKTWIVHASLADVSMRDLLTHRSGLRGGGGSYEGLKEAVATGVNNSDKGAYSYQNSNFAMFRMILPTIINPASTNNAVTDTQIEAVYALIFVDYIRESLFEPIGIQNALLYPTGNNPTQYYNFLDDSNPWVTGDYSLSAGAYGWYLSAFELANFFTHVRHDDNYLSPAMRTVMFDELLGLKSTSGDHGDYKGHGGDWFSGGTLKRGMTGAVMSFPIDVEVSLLINSRDGTHSSKYTLIRDAFDDAWE